MKLNIKRCEHCQLDSIRHSNFIELTLNIQNSHTINQCIDDLLKDEFMDGDNQYYCSNCKAKRNARRITRLNRLPPILNLQLLRFIYDRNTGHKKKLSSRIKFAEVLDLDKYVEQPSGGVGSSSQASNNGESKNLYHLGAILMHVGKSAYSGHYTAQIKSFQTQEWSNFNDESITKIKKKNQLGCTDEELETASSKKEEKEEKEAAAAAGVSKTPQSKTHSTANAYLLVYYRADWLKKQTTTTTMFETTPSSTATTVATATPTSTQTITELVPSYSYNQSEIVRLDNEILGQWFNKMQETRIDQTESKQTERAFIKEIYENLWVNKREAAVVQSVTPAAVATTNSIASSKQRTDPMSSKSVTNLGTKRQTARQAKLAELIEIKGLL
jgi:hypothetical protein